MGASDRRRAGRRGAGADPGLDPFSLGEAEPTARILEGAGFAGVRFEDVHEPVLYGHDLDAALAFVRGFQDTSAALASLSDGEAARTVERLRETLAAHYSDERASETTFSGGGGPPGGCRQGFRCPRRAP